MALNVGRLVLFSWAAVSLVSGLVEAEGFDSHGDTTRGGVLVTASVVILAALILSVATTRARLWLGVAAVAAGVSAGLYLALEA